MLILSNANVLSKFLFTKIRNIKKTKSLNINIKIRIISKQKK
jgi:hypothetical protein